jgi:hypothetical protein
LRTILSAGVLAVLLLACAGTAAGESRAVRTSIILVARVLRGLLLGFGMRFETVG